MAPSYVTAKRRNYARYVTTLLEESEIAHNTPIELSLESANACNLNCIFCALHRPGGVLRKIPGAAAAVERPRGSAGIMPARVIERVAPWFEGAASVSLHGFGEPLMNRLLVPTAAAAGLSGAYVSFFTNGKMLDAARAAALVDGSVTQITISISTADPVLYERFYERGKFELLRTNLLRLREEKRRRGSSYPSIQFNAIAFRTTLPGLPALVEFAADVGARDIELKPLVTYEGDGVRTSTPSGAEMRSERITYDPTRDEPVLEAAQRCADDLGVALVLAHYRATGEPVVGLQEATVSGRRAPRRKCPLPYRTMYVAANGRVKPCCFASNAPDCLVGDLSRQHIEEVWNGREYRALRVAHAEGRIPPACAHCFKFNLAPPNDSSADWLAVRGIDVFNHDRLFQVAHTASQVMSQVANASQGWLERGVHQDGVSAVLTAVRCGVDAVSEVGKTLRSARVYLGGFDSALNGVEHLHDSLGRTAALIRNAEVSGFEPLPREASSILSALADSWPALEHRIAEELHAAEVRAAQLEELSDSGAHLGRSSTS